MHGVENREVKMKKKDITIWISFAFKKALTTSSIMVGIRSNRIWPFNFEALH